MDVPWNERAEEDPNSPDWGSMNRGMEEINKRHEPMAFQQEREKERAVLAIIAHLQVFQFVRLN
jgi:hypothetical protein